MKYVEMRALVMKATGMNIPQANKAVRTLLINEDKDSLMEMFDRNDSVEIDNFLKTNYTITPGPRPISLTINKNISESPAE